MKSSWKKMACVGLLAAAALFSGCGNEDKVAVVDYQRIESECPKVKDIQSEIANKDKEINDRLTQAQQNGASDEEMQKKVQEAQQERMIFIQSKQKQVDSMVESQSEKIAKDKDIGIVMHKSLVPDGGIDITDEVIAGINGPSSAASSAAK